MGLILRSRVLIVAKVPIQSSIAMSGNVGSIVVGSRLLTGARLPRVVVVVVAIFPYC